MLLSAEHASRRARQGSLAALLALAGRHFDCRCSSWRTSRKSSPAKRSPPTRSNTSTTCKVRTFADDENLRLIGADAAVMDETLRLYPPVPIDLKQALHDDTLPCGAHVPAGAMVMWSAYLMGRNEQLWGADVAQFRPERWCDARTPRCAAAFHALAQARRRAPDPGQPGDSVSDRPAHLSRHELCLSRGQGLPLLCLAALPSPAAARQRAAASRTLAPLRRAMSCFGFSSLPSLRAPDRHWRHVARTRGRSFASSTSVKK